MPSCPCNMSIIAEDENLLKRAAKYLRNLVAEKQKDPTEFSKDEFFARIDQAKKGRLSNYDKARLLISD